MSDLMTQLLANESGMQREVLEHYTQRLLALARQRLPDKVRARVDPEYVVQSVYRSFFRRLRRGEFRFDGWQVNKAARILRRDRRTLASGPGGGLKPLSVTKAGKSSPIRKPLTMDPCTL